ncbi:putative glycoside hydrolase [Lentibacillus sp. N15]|uniref:putative glycoside hydrolase n=1 Tax=Lentibacillus songyuanensis TaxID=3136161 RepID=UPI0031BA3A92
MRKGHLIELTFIGMLLFGFGLPHTSSAEEMQTAHAHVTNTTSIQPIDPNKLINRFIYNAGFDFTYPDAVRGIYVTGPSAGGSRFKSLVKLVETTDLNTMVIDIKEDHGNITFTPEKGSPYEKAAKNYIDDPKKMLKYLEEKDIYPIARIVVFKDSVLAKEHPELSFKENGNVWTNGKGEAFVNPFKKEVWEYNVDLAKQALAFGFQEIQFDYVRFPEGFEHYDKKLQYSQGEYKNLDMKNEKRRVKAVTDFVKYAKKELANYDAKVGVDIFGYSATIEEAPGIGQNFTNIADNVDVISSMIYPSHWSSYFGIDLPDKHPYQLVTSYAKVENEVLGKLANPPISRPWIQDFDAPWLYDGEPTHYGKREVEAQIKALQENGINEFLVWNAGNSYTKNVDYTP